MANINRHAFVTTGEWQTSSAHSPLVDFIKQFYPISKGAINYIDKCSFGYNISKGKHLVKSGEMCDYLYFVQKGVLRGYVKEGTKEITTWITPENHIVTSIKGFYLRIPSLKNIQAIEDCELIGIHYDKLQYLFENFIEMNIAGRKLLEQYYSDSEESAFISRLPKASSKYERFLLTHDHLANRIQLKYVASFLGITIETLSRIRSKLMNT
jgi:CRP-like cAMP-binding protein